MCIGYLHFGSHFRFIIVIEKMIGSQKSQRSDKLVLGSKIWKDACNSTMNLEIVRRH